MADKEVNNAPGEPTSMKHRALESGAAAMQDFSPVNQICAHLNAFHSYASDPTRCVEANHYCTHVNEDVRQCIIYDSPEANARLIGVEYMVSPRIFATLDHDEKKMWHSHSFEVKSGMLIMPGPTGVPNAVWEKAEKSEMNDVIGWYGKTFHFWQVDRGDKLPLGPPQLMMSYTSPSQIDLHKKLKDRDSRFGTDYKHKAEIRKDIPEPEVAPDVDIIWTQGKKIDMVPEESKK
ncbi:MAG: hypothetical protein M1817_005668 [Caeruleum heppii]|nr:MAG: hypothetical protein M1817_005668 [Caeruleum heppii]